MLVGSPPSGPSGPDKAEANRSLDLVPMQGPSENGPSVLTKEIAMAPKPEGRISSERVERKMMMEISFKLCSVYFCCLFVLWSVGG